MEHEMYVDPFLVKLVMFTIVPVALVAPLVSAALAVNYLLFLKVQLPTMLENVALRERLRVQKTEIRSPVKRGYSTPDTFTGFLNSWRTNTTQKMTGPLFSALAI